MTNSAIAKCSDEQKKAIFKLKNSDEVHLEENVKIIQNWVKSQPHFPEMPETCVIQKFLFMHDFNITQVKKRISYYYVIRSVLPDMFNVDPKHPNAIKCMKACEYLVTPNLTPDLGRVIVIRINEETSEDFDVSLYMSYALLITEIRLREDFRLRDVFLYDLKSVKFSHLAQLSPLLIKKISIILRKVYNDTDAYINIINVAPFAQSFLKVMKSMYPQKVQEKFMIHENLESVFKVIPKESLPVDYGGTAGTVKELRARWDQKMEEYDPLFAHLRSLKIDNDLLPENLKIDDHFGVHGNFKKLNVD